MTTHFITTNTINAGADAIDLSTGDTLFIAGGVIVAGGTNGTLAEGASSSGSGISAQILGTLWGSDRGLDFYGTDGGDTVFVGAGASVIGVTADGVSLSGNNDIVTNNGEITASTTLSNSTIAGVSMYGSDATVTNTGTISGDFGVFLDSDGDFVNNSGTIDGTRYGIIAITPAAGRTDTIDNSGTIRAGSNGAAITVSNEGTGNVDITNSGHLVGYVGLGEGNDTYDGTLGSVTAGVSGGEGNDILLGGAGSEYLDGGEGNDVLEWWWRQRHARVGGEQRHRWRRRQRFHRCGRVFPGRRPDRRRRRPRHGGYFRPGLLHRAGCGHTDQCGEDHHR